MPLNTPSLEGTRCITVGFFWQRERERERERESRAHPFQMMDGAAHPRGTGGLLPPQAPSKAKQRGRESEGTRAGREDCSRPKPQAKQSKERETERDRERES